jgi:tetratricopeptide (TPR) repeat protein
MLANRRQMSALLMTDWLRLLGMIFYAPFRGMREVRDRGALLPAIVCAYLSQLAYVFAVAWLSGNKDVFVHPAALGAAVFQAAASLLPIALVLVPVLALIANMFDRKGSFGVVVRQEYASLASVLFYVLVATNLASILIALFFHFSGIQTTFVANMIQQTPQTLEMWRSMGVSAEALARMEKDLNNQAAISEAIFFIPKFFLLSVGSVMAVREVFRPSVVRAIAIAMFGGIITLVLSPLWYGLFHTLLASPFLLLMLFFLLRGYFTEVVGNQRARAAFKQNLEVATINPRDSSAHYNLGLIHQQRLELDLARERFQRAIDIDPDELDAHYQLGRIARAQGRLAEAITHFEEVVQRDQSHAQQEIWREIGSTYIAAGQYSDARDVLEKFLDHRPNDPEALYLLGRAHAGLGDSLEAASSMQACIDAVKTAPAYKYRTEKRWLNEAQQFLKGRREAVSSRH